MKITKQYGKASALLTLLEQDKQDGKLCSRAVSERKERKNTEPVAPPTVERLGTGNLESGATPKQGASNT